MQGAGAFLCRDAYIGQDKASRSGEISLAYQRVMMTERGSVVTAFGFNLLRLIQLSD